MSPYLLDRPVDASAVIPAAELTRPPRPTGRSVHNGEHSYFVTETGRGEDTVLLHGGGPGCTGWSDFGPALGRLSTRRRCIVPDLLQYGRSDKPDIDEGVWDFHARNLLALFDALELERPDVVCNSWGGTAAIRLASLHPSRVNSLVITGSMPVFYGPLAPLPERSRRGRNARDAYYGGDGPSWAKMRDLITRLEWFDPDALPDETVTLRYEQSLDAGERRLGESDDHRGTFQDLSVDVQGLQVPVLYLWGMYDAFLTPDYALMLARMTPFGSVFVMDRAGHHLQEERPSDYSAVVLGWLDRKRGMPGDGVAT